MSGGWMCWFSFRTSKERRFTPENSSRLANLVVWLCRPCLVVYKSRTEPEKNEETDQVQGRDLRFELRIKFDSNRISSASVWLEHHLLISAVAQSQQGKKRKGKKNWKSSVARKNRLRKGFSERKAKNKKRRQTFWNSRSIKNWKCAIILRREHKIEVERGCEGREETKWLPNSMFDNIVAALIDLSRSWAKESTIGLDWKRWLRVKSEIRFGKELLLNCLHLKTDVRQFRKTALAKGRPE